MTGGASALFLLLASSSIPPAIIDPAGPVPTVLERKTPVTPAHPAELWRCVQLKAEGHAQREEEYVVDGLKFWDSASPYVRPWILVYNDSMGLIAVWPFVGDANGPVSIADARTLVINKQTGDMSVVNVDNPAESGLKEHCEHLQWPSGS